MVWSLTYHIAYCTILAIGSTYEREGALKLSRIIGRGLLLVMLLACFAYSQPTTPPVPVTISRNCATDVDQAQARIDEEVIWKSPNHNYSYQVDFGDRSPFAVSSVAADKPEPVTGTFWCNRVFVYALSQTNVCYFPYSLSKNVDGVNKPCADPGVRVVPPGGSLIGYLLFVAVLGILSYVAFRIRSRNRTSSPK